MIRSIAAAIVIFFVSLPSYAVDGYKDLKFGMGASDVLANQPCTLLPATSQYSRITIYGCDDLQFGNALTTAGAFLIDGKLLRVGIQVPSNSALNTLDALIDKYGAPSTTYSSEELQRIGKTPNAEVIVNFDMGTILLHLRTQPNLSTTAFLIYQDTSYEALFEAIQKEAIASAL